MSKKEVKTFGNRVRAVRNRLQLTQKDFGLELGISLQHLSDIELDKKKPCHDFFFNMVKVFKANLNYLLLGEGEMFLGEKEKEGAIPKRFKTGNPDVDLDIKGRCVGLLGFWRLFYRLMTFSRIPSNFHAHRHLYFQPVQYLFHRLGRIIFKMEFRGNPGHIVKSPDPVGFQEKSGIRNQRLAGKQLPHGINKPPENPFACFNFQGIGFPLPGWEEKLDEKLDCPLRP